ncbi:sterol regulatory element-binding protein cleavage-activating protein isoform X2 [Anopheles coustani]|uniref:sterol regulatory element-binding protein cleavage-activating protein isoform X2 n=1 Tax=Anopheles coustani TaxID=139045 RepID=UPI00265B2978|nr:sterol regulatory element-binding protein cleavage-activating protein isoform X2 [Anopheles coustani]
MTASASVESLFPSTPEQQHNNHNHYHHQHPSASTPTASTSQQPVRRSQPLNSLSSPKVSTMSGGFSQQHPALMVGSQKPPRSSVGGASVAAGTGGRAGAKQSDRRSASTTLPSRVSQMYYKHGLFLSSYPTTATSIALAIIIFCCYPLLNIPLPGTIPTKVIFPHTESISENLHLTNANLSSEFYNPFSFSGGNMFNIYNISMETPFPWARIDPLLYVQQVIMRTSVVPWEDDLLLTDAFRGPLYEVFKLVEIIRNHEDKRYKVTLGHLCLHVENVKRSSQQALFPEYNCLLLSPANLWQQNMQNFNKDSNLLNTIFVNHNLQKSKVSNAEMLFGIPLRDTGVKRYPMRTRPRIIQYAVTLILRENNPAYIESLRSKLVRAYPLHQKNTSAKEQPMGQQSIMYIFYPGEFNWKEVLPQCVAFVLLFIYVYFSVRKIEAIRSRLMLASCAVLTVLGSLLMSLGLCFFFGLTISFQSKGVYPYLVILVGLENVLVITKSILTTDNNLDVKIRVAQGLSREGWSITKNLLTEITILTGGLATFVPVIQEFCIFAMVGLVSDFLLQMLFFATVLALDIKRVEYSTEVRRLPKMLYFNSEFRRGAGNVTVSGSTLETRNGAVGSINRSRSHPKLTGLDQATGHQKSAASLSGGTGSGKDAKIPKRLRIVNFWARTRFFQRGFMIWMVLWISNIIYNAGLIEELFVIDKNMTAYGDISSVGLDNTVSRFELSPGSHEPHEVSSESVSALDMDRLNFQKLPDGLQVGGGATPALNVTEQLNRLKHPDYETVYQLSNFHWSSILKQYNVSLSGRYVTILPPIKLSHAVSPQTALQLRNVDEKAPHHFQWKALAVALDPLDFNDADTGDGSPVPIGNAPFYPKTPMEILLTCMLLAVSTFVLTYTMIVLYRCVCTRNYAEWRASWHESDSETDASRPEQCLLEGVPIQVNGHAHRIECLVTDGNMIASSCLQGQVKIWDVTNGEQMAEIDRCPNQQLQQQQHQQHQVSPIWCLDFLDNLIVIGCADGRLEFWEGSSGNFKCIYEAENSHNNGVTNIKLTGDRVIAARLSGRIDFFRLETYTQGRQIDWGFTSAYRRTHMRTGSAGSLSSFQAAMTPSGTAGSYQQHGTADSEELRCILEFQQQGHQQPVTCLEVAGNTVMTGSQDHTLKVFRVDNHQLLYTLHSHCGPITCLFIDHWQSGMAGSGSQDGLLCVWDLTTGACMYKIQAHDDSIVALAGSPSYVISLGLDERIRVWDRFQGHPLNTITVSHAYSALVMLTPSLLVTGKPGALVVWDARSGEVAREVKLDCSNMQLCPKIMLPACGSVICDYGNQMRVVRFPLVAADKCD